MEVSGAGARTDPCIYIECLRWHLCCKIKPVAEASKVQREEPKDGQQSVFLVTGRSTPPPGVEAMLPDDELRQGPSGPFTRPPRPPPMWAARWNGYAAPSEIIWRLWDQATSEHSSLDTFCLPSNPPLFKYMRTASWGRWQQTASHMCFCVPAPGFSVGPFRSRGTRRGLVVGRKTWK